MAEVDFAAMRAAMVASQLRTSDVNDPAVIAAMATVPREDFVSSARKDTAYTDRPVPLGDRQYLNPPLATGRLLNAAEISPGDAVLLIGDVTGYSATLLDQMGAQIIVVSDSARPLKLAKSIDWVKSAPAKGHAKKAPYAAIIVDGAIPEFPAELVKQLADGGHVAFGLDDRGVTRLCAGRKAGGVIGFSRLGDLEMVRVAGVADKPVEFTF